MIAISHEVPSLCQKAILQGNIVALSFQVSIFCLIMHILNIKIYTVRISSTVIGSNSSRHILIQLCNVRKQLNINIYKVDLFLFCELYAVSAGGTTAEEWREWLSRDAECSGGWQMRALVWLT